VFELGAIVFAPGAQSSGIAGSLDINVSVHGQFSPALYDE
jgi:hypothetical protein